MLMHINENKWKYSCSSVHKKKIYKYNIMDTINYKVIFCGHVEISRQFQFNMTLS
jgi:hypothetical protein